MDLEVFTCCKCGMKSVITKEQLRGHIFCQRCGAKSDLTMSLQEKVSGNTQRKQGRICYYCGKKINLNSIEGHNDSCEMYPIYCKICNAKFIRRDMSSHVQECLCSFRQCKFSPIGCEFQGNPLEVEKHEVGNCHAELMMKSLLTLQTEKECCKEMKIVLDNLKETTERQETEIDSYKKQMIDLKLKQSSMQFSLDQQSKEIQRLERNSKIQADEVTTAADILTKRQMEHCDNVENCQKTMATVMTANNALTKVVANDKKILSNKIDDVIKKQKEFENDYAEFKNEMQVDLKNKLASTAQSFEYVWKVTKMEDHLHNAKLKRRVDISGNPFYTAKVGYKMRLQLTLLATGLERHFYLSLVVMLGPNDALLSWPVQYRGRVTLLAAKKELYSGLLKSDIEVYKSCFDKPLNEENEGYEIAVFSSSDKFINTRLVDDTLIVKLKLEITS